MAAYGFIASVLPVWMLLCPRDYLSSYLKVGTIIFLIIGVMVVAPNLNMPAFTPFTAGGGPVIPENFIRSCSSRSRAGRSPAFMR
jgi:carbon starvation protein